MLCDAKFAVTTPDSVGDLQVCGTGSSLPGPALTIDEVLHRFGSQIPATQGKLARRVARRLQIRYRHIARALVEPIEAVRPEDSGPRLAARAIGEALRQAGATVDSISFLIGHTATPHTLLPSNTAWTADELNFAGPHIELRQACTGFAAATLLAGGLHCIGKRYIAIVGSETGSVYFDPRRIAEDPGQIVNLAQMGDGAGAILLGPVQAASASRIERPFFGSTGMGQQPGLLLTDGGAGSPSIATVGGAPSVPIFKHLHETIKTNGIALLRASLEAAKSTGINQMEVDWYLPHQANGRMAEICARYLDLPVDSVICSADTVGNLGSASIWVALDRLRRSGKLVIGDRVLVLGAEATKYLYGGFLYVHGTT